MTKVQVRRLLHQLLLWRMRSAGYSKIIDILIPAVRAAPVSPAVPLEDAAAYVRPYVFGDAAVADACTWTRSSRTAEEQISASPSGAGSTSCSCGGCSGSCWLRHVGYSAATVFSSGSSEACEVARFAYAASLARRYGGPSSTDLCRMRSIQSKRQEGRSLGKG